MAVVNAEPRRILASEVEAAQAEVVSRALATQAAGRWTARGAAGPEVTVPEELSGLVTAIVRILARGGSVTVGSIPAEITTTTAAEILEISRPTLMKLVRSGELPSHKVGTHTRLMTADVSAFRKAQLAQRKQALEDLMALEDAG